MAEDHDLDDNGEDNEEEDEVIEAFQGERVRDIRRRVEQLVRSERPRESERKGIIETLRRFSPVEKTAYFLAIFWTILEFFSSVGGRPHPANFREHFEQEHLKEKYLIGVDAGIDPTLPLSPESLHFWMPPAKAGFYRELIGHAVEKWMNDRARSEQRARELLREQMSDIVDREMRRNLTREGMYEPGLGEIVKRYTLGFSSRRRKTSKSRRKVSPKKTSKSRSRKGSPKKSRSRTRRGSR